MLPKNINDLSRGDIGSVLILTTRKTPVVREFTEEREPWQSICRCPLNLGGKGWSRKETVEAKKAQDSKYFRRKPPKLP